MADPGFPREGASALKVRELTYFLSKMSPANCMKMKDFGRGGGEACVTWVDSTVHGGFFHTLLNFKYISSIFNINSTQ